MSARAHRDLDSVIRHLRRKRRRIVQARRRRNIVASAGALALALALASAIAVASFAGTDLAGAAATRAHDFLDLMSERSPGARTEAQLTKMRHEVLAERSAAVPPEYLPLNLAEILAPAEHELAPVNLAAPPLSPQFMAATPFEAVIASLPGGDEGGSGGGKGGGGGGGGGGSPPVAQFTAPPPAVPEPGTWMTMLFGFGAMGWLLRRNKAVIVSRRAA